MAKKKKGKQGLPPTPTPTHSANASSFAAAASPPSPANNSTSANAPNGRVSTQREQHQLPPSLNISRNKHWRFISAYHGPWLQLELEVLEIFTHNNFLSARPRQTEPGVLYDLLKIRQLVDEASDLAVRAQNGTASSALAHSDNGLPGSALGLSYRGHSGNARLSPERKFRMRELAVQRLSQAYRLDEIAASVATMQGASALDHVASLVLQRNPKHTDAQYVHFFHEKIPSRMMAECTPLAPLDEIIAREPGHAAPYRTRALTKIFKEDFLGSLKDLSEALALCKLESSHRTGSKQLVPLSPASPEKEMEQWETWTKDWMYGKKVPEEHRPNSLELQLLFQRGNQYLTLACSYIGETLECFRKAKQPDLGENGAINTERYPSDSDTKSERDVTSLKDKNGAKNGHKAEGDSDTMSKDKFYKQGLEARDLLRKYAKRALRDYTTFFSRLDYAHAPAHEAGDVFSRDRVTQFPDDTKQQLLKDGENEGEQSTALIRRPSYNRRDSFPAPMPTIYPISELLSPAPPTDLPPFPEPNSSALVRLSSSQSQPPPQPEHYETITFHPLMPETLHSLLLAHCLLQTPTTTLLRHAHNVARVARLADGHPFFLTARSPARADWCEILRKSNDFIGLSQSWESLSKPTRGSASTKTPSSPEAEQPPPTKPRRPTSSDRDRIHKHAVLEALSDDRVVDDTSFKRAVAAHERRALEDGSEDQADGDNERDTGKVENSKAKKNEVAKDEEYLIGTLRAEAIARWVLEAPNVSEVSTGTSKKKKGKKKPVVVEASALDVETEE